MLRPTSMSNVDGRRERSSVNSRIDAFLRDHRASIHRSNDRVTCTAYPSPFFVYRASSLQQPIPLSSSIFRILLSPFLSLSLFFSFLTVNFDKEPFFFTESSIFSSPAVPLPIEHLKEAIWGFRGSRRFVTLTLNLTMDSEGRDLVREILIEHRVLLETSTYAALRMKF